MTISFLILAVLGGQSVAMFANVGISVLSSSIRSTLELLVDLDLIASANLFHLLVSFGYS